MRDRQSCCRQAVAFLAVARAERNCTTDTYELVRRDVSRLVVAQQGPPPPNPLVVERFQQVISQLFQQVCPRSDTACSRLTPKLTELASVAVLCMSKRCRCVRCVSPSRRVQPGPFQIYVVRY